VLRRLRADGRVVIDRAETLLMELRRVRLALEGEPLSDANQAERTVYLTMRGARSGGDPNIADVAANSRNPEEHVGNVFRGDEIGASVRALDYGTPRIDLSRAAGSVMSRTS
jgi:hypothetical protein